MEFTELLKQFSKRIQSIKEQISTEEATKTAIIMPFFQLLGYDIFNPDEFIPEFTADVGIKKGERVDYAIRLNNQLTLLVECKPIGEKLDNHNSQLYRYFSVTKARFAVLTNGVEYKFFTDLDEPNKMDQKPFLEVDLLNIKESDGPQLMKFHKSSFDINSILTSAEELKYSNQIYNLLNKQLEEVDDNFVNYILNEIYSNRKTQNVIEKFKPIIKRSLNIFISERVNNKLKTALEDNISAKTEGSIKIDQESNEEVTKNKTITTTEELEGYYIVKNILKDSIDLKRVFSRDNESYFNILLDNSIRKWICRLHLNGINKYIELNSGKNEKYLLSDLYDIYKYSESIKTIAKTF